MWSTCVARSQLERAGRYLFYLLFATNCQILVGGGGHNVNAGVGGWGVGGAGRIRERACRARARAPHRARLLGETSAHAAADPDMADGRGPAQRYREQKTYKAVCYLTGKYI